MNRIPLLLSAAVLASCGSRPPAPLPVGAEVTIHGRKLRAAHAIKDPDRRFAADRLASLGPEEALLLSWNRSRFLHLFATRAPGSTFDVAFLGESGKVLGLQPLSGDSDVGVTSQEEATRALVLPPGWASRHLLRKGDEVGLSQAVVSTRVEPMPIVRVDGHVVHVETSHLSDQRQRGLMHRPRMSADDGMLFIYSEPSERRFWMGHTLIPLDIAYFDSGGALLNVCRMQTYPDPSTDTEPKAPSAGPTQFVLEVNWGWFDQRKLIDAEGLPLKRVLLELPDAVKTLAREAE